MKTLYTRLNVILILLLSFSFEINFAQMLKVEMEEISVNSHSIIKGIVSKKWSEYEESGKGIITIIEFNVLETIKGVSSRVERGGMSGRMRIASLIPSKLAGLCNGASDTHSSILFR